MLIINNEFAISEIMTMKFYTQDTNCLIGYNKHTQHTHTHTHTHKSQILYTRHIQDKLTTLIPSLLPIEAHVNEETQTLENEQSTHSDSLIAFVWQKLKVFKSQILYTRHVQ